MREKGFGVRKDDLKYRGPGPKQNAYRRTYKCCKQGWWALKHFNRADRKRTPRGTIFLGVGVPLFFRLSYKIVVASGSSRILWTSITICLSLLT